MDGIPELCPIKFNGRNGGHGTCKINYAAFFPQRSLRLNVTINVRAVTD